MQKFLGEHVHQDDAALVEDELKRLRVQRTQSHDFDIVLPKMKKTEREEATDEEKSDKSSDESDQFVVEATPRSTQTRGRGRGRGRGRAKTVKTTPPRAKRNPF